VKDKKELEKMPGHCSKKQFGCCSFLHIVLGSMLIE